MRRKLLSALLALALCLGLLVLPASAAGETTLKSETGAVLRLSSPVLREDNSGRYGETVYYVPAGTTITVEGARLFSVRRSSPNAAVSERTTVYLDENRYTLTGAGLLYEFRFHTEDYALGTMTFAVDGPAPAGTACASTQSVEVDGRAVEFQMYALKDENGNPTNYVKVRDVAMLLNGTDAQFEVGYDAAAKAVSLEPGKPYTANGSELYTPFTGDRPWTRPSGKTLVSGKDSALDAILLTDDEGGGFTYYKLRDLGQALGFNVGWSKDRGVYVESDRPYSAEG